MPRSLLTYREFSGDRGSDSPLLVMLHGLGADDEQFMPLYQALKPPYDACVLRAPVPVVPPTGYRPEAAERTWYICESICRPEPVSFGSSLWQLEQLLRDVRDRVGSGRPIVLIGRDQGAALCLTMAAIAPDWLVGVVAIDACIPAINGWPFPANDTGGLPVLFVSDSNPLEADQRFAEIAVREFCGLNAVVEVVPVEGLSNSLAAIAPVVSPWLEKRTATHVRRT